MDVHLTVIPIFCPFIPIIAKWKQNNSESQNLTAAIYFLLKHRYMQQCNATVRD